MLTQYQNRLKRLLQNPAAPTSLYATADLTDWINQARDQVALEGQCVRFLGELVTVVGQRNYDFVDIDIGTALATGRQGVLHVRSIRYGVADGSQMVYARAWEWFNQFNLNNPAPQAGAPEEWAQYGQGSGNVGLGSGQSGSFYLDPAPDFTYTLTPDCVCYPVVLTDDTTVEAIPYPFTDAVAFLAAYFALLSAQMNARSADAERMFNYYMTFMERAGVTPTQQAGIYQRSMDPTLPGKLGLKPQGQA